MWRSNHKIKQWRRRPNKRTENALKLAQLRAARAIGISYCVLQIHLIELEQSTGDLTFKFAIPLLPDESNCFIVAVVIGQLQRIAKVSRNSTEVNQLKKAIAENQIEYYHVDNWCFETAECQRCY